MPATLSPVEAVPGGPAPDQPADQQLGPNPASPAAPAGGNGPDSIKKLTRIVPTSTFGVSAAVGSILLTCCLSACLACRRCRKRGKGTMTNGTKSKRGGGGSSSSSSSRKKDKKNGKLDLGDFLGRSKDGFQRVRTEEDDGDVDDLSSESDDMEEFSVPALRA